MSFASEFQQRVRAVFARAQAFFVKRQDGAMQRGASDTAPWAGGWRHTPRDSPARPAWRRWLRFAGLAAATLVAVPFALIVLYRFVDPPVSTLMAGHILTGRDAERTWLPLAEMATVLPVTVALSEDARLCRHHGVDFEMVREVLADAEDWRGVRGTSTIAMQTAKNLFLWPQRNFVRKIFEVPLALAIDLVWPKRRLMEIYLNIAEWGPGIFGAEAAAQYHFAQSARDLDASQAALLAAALPNPALRHAGDAGPRTQALADRIAERATRESADVACIAPVARAKRAGFAASPRL